MKNRCSLIIFSLFIISLAPEAIAQSSSNEKSNAQVKPITAPSQETPKAQSEIIKAPQGSAPAASAPTISAPKGDTLAPKNSEIIKVGEEVADSKVPQAQVIKAPKNTESESSSSEVLREPKNAPVDEEKLIKNPKGTAPVAEFIRQPGEATSPAAEKQVISAPTAKDLEPRASEILRTPAAQKTPAEAVRAPSQTLPKESKSEVIKAPKGTAKEAQSEVLRSPRTQ